MEYSDWSLVIFYCKGSYDSLIPFRLEQLLSGMMQNGGSSWLDARFESEELRCQRWDVLHIMTSLVYPKQMIGIWSPGRQILPFVGWCWMLLQSSRKIIIEHRWKCLNCIQKLTLLLAADCFLLTKSAKSSCLVIQRMQIFNGLIVLSCSFV